MGTYFVNIASLQKHHGGAVKTNQPKLTRQHVSQRAQERTHDTNATTYHREVQSKIQHFSIHTVVKKKQDLVFRMQLNSVILCNRSIHCHIL